jgi:hypothetical protein
MGYFAWMISESGFWTASAIGRSKAARVADIWLITFFDMLQKMLRSFELWRNAIIKAFCRADTLGLLILLDVLPKPSDTLSKDCACIWIALAWL